HTAHRLYDCGDFLVGRGGQVALAPPKKLGDGRPVSSVSRRAAAGHAAMGMHRPTARAMLGLPFPKLPATAAVLSSPSQIVALLSETFSREPRPRPRARVSVTPPSRTSRHVN